MGSTDRSQRREWAGLGVEGRGVPDGEAIF